ncbi:MAG: lactate utilization protein [Candidatus Omnitrophica bacterium]|nr:lactate utilization protein [Candidatus Omnitrophota bacterium]
MDQRVDNLIKNWQHRYISGIYCVDKKEAADRILEIIPGDASVGLSGSVTLEEIGIIKALEARGTNVFNQYRPGVSREEGLDLRKKGARADYYLTSANAISEKGELVFFSAYGQRIAGISSAKNLIVVCGINKITPNLEEALQRARQYATPLNCKRLNWASACLKDGICRKEICLLPDYKRMCSQVLVIEAETAPERVKVILVGEKLGF